MPVGRLVGLAVMLLMAALYVGPVQKYLATQRQAAHQQAVLIRLERRHAYLQSRIALLTPRGTAPNPAIVAIARRCGWIMPGERPLLLTRAAGASSAPDC